MVWCWDHGNIMEANWENNILNGNCKENIIELNAVVWKVFLEVVSNGIFWGISFSTNLIVNKN